MSSKKARIIADLLFGGQVIGALVFCGAYIVRSLADVTGSSLVQFSLVTTFLLLHLALSIGAHRAAPSRVTRQAVCTYTLWITLYVGIIGTVITNTSYTWNSKETAQLLSATVLTIVVLIVFYLKRRKLSDPMTKALFAIAYKSVPQVLLAWKFLAEGASGTPGLAIAAGHFTILTRLGQIYFLVREAGWDRNRIWLAISESLNEASWIVASVAWLIVL